MPLAAIYARVSTDIQAEKGYSIPTQIDACKKAINGYVVEEYVDDGYSGAFLERPALDRLRSDLKTRKFQAVVIYDPDRLARKLVHQLMLTEEIERSGAQLIFVNTNYDHTPEGNLFYSMRGAIAEYEREKIRERTMRGKRGKALDGKIVGAGLFGYTLTDDSTYVINEEQADIIRTIYDMAAQGNSLIQISRSLFSMGIPSPTGNHRWAVSTLHRILTNSSYKGDYFSMREKYTKVGPKERTKHIRDQKDWIPIPIPAIISDEIWDKAAKSLKHNKSVAKRNTQHFYLCRGLLYCSKCGHKLTGNYSVSGGIPRFYYLCSTRFNNIRRADNTVCRSRTVPADTFDHEFWQLLTEFSKKPKSIAQYAIQSNTQSQNLEQNIEKLNGIINDLEGQRQTVMRWFREKKISEADADSQLVDIQKQLKDVQTEKGKWYNELSPQQPQRSLTEISGGIRSEISGHTFSNEEKRTVIERYVRKIYVERIDHNKNQYLPPKFLISIEFI